MSIAAPRGTLAHSDNPSAGEEETGRTEELIDQLTCVLQVYRETLSQKNKVNGWFLRNET